MLSYALSTTQTLNWIVRSATEVETKYVDSSTERTIKPTDAFRHSIVSVERVQEYISLTPEAPLEIPEKQPSPEWPQSGSIKFEHVAARYREGLDLVLKDVNFEIKAGEKIGVVGRTGAGKSSLTMVSFWFSFSILRLCNSPHWLYRFSTESSRLKRGRSPSTELTSQRLVFTTSVLESRSFLKIRNVSKDHYVVCPHFPGL